MNSIIVSVIIPIYNVEKYLENCVDSVIRQTFQNIQIILVNDGSTDSCGRICDEYAQKDKRVIVVHKDNGGLSDARNAGLLLAKGAFILYLDSDDYLVPNAIEILVRMQEKTDADIVLGNFYYTYSDHESLANAWCQADRVLDNKQAMEALIDGRIETFAWGKLLCKEIAEKYQFPKGKIFEDHYWTHFVFSDADVIALVALPLVHYRQRENSISFTVDMKRLDILDGWMNRKAFLEQRYPELLEICYRRYAERYVELAWLILTRMKRGKIAAFQKLRVYNEMLNLQNYADKNNKKIICALDRGNLVYAIYALWNRVSRGK